MKTTLVFDYDGSLASIGGKEKLQQTFGISPIRIHKGLAQTKEIIKNLIQPVQRTTNHPLHNGSIVEDGFELSDKAKELELEFLIFDTASALGFQERNQLKLKRKIDTMDQRSWGLYGDSINSFIYNVCSLPIKTVFNFHIDRDKDVGGEIIDVPAIKGSSKNEIQKWFDVILFTRVTTDPKTKETQFFFQTKPEEGRFCKDRLGILPAIIPQDFSLIFEEYAKHGIEHPNILVLGESGTGKSRALASINKNNQLNLRKVS
jgi:hypothetical protein